MPTPSRGNLSGAVLNMQPSGGVVVSWATVSCCIFCLPLLLAASPTKVLVQVLLVNEGMCTR